MLQPHKAFLLPLGSGITAAIVLQKSETTVKMSFQLKLEINKVFTISRSLKQRNEMFNISNILDSALFQGDRRSGFPWVVFLSQSVCLDDTQMCGLSGFRHGKSIGGMLLNKTKGDVHEDIHANSSRITTLHSTCC